MTEEILLQAIGYVEEDILMDTENVTYKKKHKLLPKAILIAAILVALSTVAVASVHHLAIRNAYVSYEQVPKTVYSLDFEVLETGIKPIYKVNIDVEMPKDIPILLENTYLIQPKDWNYSGGGYATSDGMLSQFNTIWHKSDWNGDRRNDEFIFFRQESGYFYNHMAEKVIDVLDYIPENVKVQGEIKQFGEIEAYVVTIPAIDEDNTEYYMQNGEKRVYFFNHDSLFHLWVPASLTDMQIKDIIDSMYLVDIYEKLNIPKVITSP